MNPIYEGDLVTLRVAFGVNPTKLAAGVAAGATSITVRSISGYAAANAVMIGAGTDTEESLVVSGTPSGNTIVLTTALLYNHARDEPVMEPTNPTTMVLKVEKADRSNDLYPPTAMPTNVSAGVYTQQITADVGQVGVWEWEAIGTGAVQKTLRGKFEVLKRL